jgi:rhodanese-related sulfurtransferase
MFKNSVPEVAVADAERLMASESVYVVDVREAWEYRRAHLPGVISVPLGELQRGLASLPRDRRLLVVCEHGSRSLAGAQFLASQGFDGVASIAGGTAAWVRAGLPVEKE